MHVQWTLAYPATTGADHGQISEIAGYTNHHANRVYIVSLLALPFLFLSCYPSSVQTIVVFQPFQASNVQNSGIFAYSNDLVQLLCFGAAWALNRMHRDRGRIIRAAGYLRFG